MDQFLSINKAAHLIDVSPWTIRKWIKEKRLCYFKFGGAVRIRVKDLLSFSRKVPSRVDVTKKIAQ